MRSSGWGSVWEGLADTFRRYCGKGIGTGEILREGTGEGGEWDSRGGGHGDRQMNWGAGGGGGFKFLNFPAKHLQSAIPGDRYLY